MVQITLTIAQTQNKKLSVYRQGILQCCNLFRPKQQHQRIKSAIRVRTTRFRPEQVQRHYDATLLSHFLTALSITFPQVNVFVETVRNVRTLVNDAELQAEISGFIGQEAHHAQAHEQFNQAIQSDDYHLYRYNQAFAAEMIRLRTLSQHRQLAATVAWNTLLR